MDTNIWRGVVVAVFMLQAVPVMAHHGEHQQAVIDIAGHEKPPQLIAQWGEPSGGYYHLKLQPNRFLTAKWQGHVQVVVNGETVATSTADILRIPKQWLRPGLNSISLVLSNPDNLPYHWQGRAVQATFLVDTRSDSMVKNRYLWPS